MHIYVYRVRPEHRSGRGTYWRAGGAGYTDDIDEAGRYGDTARVEGSERSEAVLLADELDRLGCLDVIASKIHADHPHLHLSAVELVRKAVHNAGMGRFKMTRRAHVMEIFGEGAGVAMSICEACGADPDEIIGEDEIEYGGEE